MTKELNSLTNKELKAYQEATKTLAKIFDLTSEDIDAFFSLIKHSKDLSNGIKSLDKRLEALERTITKNVDIQNKELAQKAYNALNIREERIKL